MKNKNKNTKNKAPLVIASLILALFIASSFIILYFDVSEKRDTITGLQIAVPVEDKEEKTEDTEEEIVDEYSGDVKLSQYRITKTTPDINFQPSGSLVNEVSKYEPIIQKAAIENGIPPALLKAVMSQESTGNPKAVSYIGTAGLMQFMPATARGYGLNVPKYTEVTVQGCYSSSGDLIKRKYPLEVSSCNKCRMKDGSTPYFSNCEFDKEVDERFDETKAIEAAAKFLKELLDRYNNDLELALAAYNWGGGNVQAKCNIEEGFGSCKDVPDETLKHIPKVLNYYIYFGGDASSDAIAVGGGTYSVRPSFRAKIKYNLDVYETIREQADELIQECSNEPQNEIRECISKKLAIFNKDDAPLQWDLESKLDGELVLYDFVDNFRQCNEAPIPEGEDFCICNFSLEYPSSDIKRAFYVIKMEQHSEIDQGIIDETELTGLRISLVKPKDISSPPLTIPTDQVYFIEEPDNDDDLFVTQSVDEAILEFEYRAGGKPGGKIVNADNDVCLGYGKCEGGNDCDCENQLDLFNKGIPQLLLYKTPTKIAFLDDNLYFGGKLEDAPLCELQSKKYYIFSVTQTDVIMAAVDDDRDKVEYNIRGFLRPKIQFALFIGSESPKQKPPLEGKGIALGDSITHGSGSGYSTTLSASCNKDIVNLGIVGYSTGNMKEILRRFLAGEQLNKDYQGDGDTSNDFVAQPPKYVKGEYSFITILGGVNNIGMGAPSIQKDLSEIYAMAKDEGLEVIILTLTPWSGWSSWSDESQATTEQVNQWILSKPNNVDYVVDIYKALATGPGNNILNSSYDSGDGLHPNTAGQKVIADQIIAQTGLSSVCSIS